MQWTLTGLTFILWSFCGTYDLRWMTPATGLWFFHGLRLYVSYSFICLTLSLCRKAYKLPGKLLNLLK